ncbi:MAG: hypothetical protein ACR2KO_15655 [Geodermatophilaceae bacterium]|jgi:hypothetical protein
MPETPAEFHARVTAAVQAAGYRDWDVSQWMTWPFDGELTMRPLDPPVLPEPPRGGEGNRSCAVCEPSHPPIWSDEHFRLGLGHEPTGLPFAGWLMPHEHLDVGDLDDERAARLGVLLVRLDRAIRRVLHVSRVQVARWGDGQAHGHLYVYARPTGLLQLRGTFLSHWDELLPPVPDDIRDADAALVAAELARTAGGRTGSG